MSEDCVDFVANYDFRVQWIGNQGRACRVGWDNKELQGKCIAT